MNTIEEYQSFIDDCERDMTELASGLTEERSAFDDGEQARWDELDGWVRAAEAQIERLARINDIASRTRPVAADAPVAERAEAPNVNTRGAADVWETRSLAGRPVSDVRAQALTAIESLDRTTDEVRERLTDFVERRDNKHGHGAMHVLATGSPAYREAWRTALLDDPVLVTDEQRQALAQARAAITLTSGFSFPVTVDPSILYIGDGSRNEIRQIADVRSIVTGTHYVNTVAAATASMDGEAAEVSDDTPADDNVQIDAKKAQAFVQWTIESEQDLPALEADLLESLRKAKDDLEASQMAIGSGSGNNVQGVMIGATSTVNSAGSGAFAVADLYALQNALPPDYESNAAWLAAKATYNRVRQFGTADSHALWTRLSEGMPALLLGDPHYRNSSVVSAVSTGNEILAYGDFRSGYRVVDRVGMNVERVALMMNTSNNRPDGTRGLYAYWRFGAGVTNANALRVLTIAA